MRLAVVTATLVAAVGAAAAGMLPPSPTAYGSEPYSADPMFGYNEDWRAKGKLLRKAGRHGADITRSVLSWWAVEPRRGIHDWSHYDRLYAQMIRAETRPVWVLSDAPCWSWSQRPKRCARKGKIAHPPSHEHDSDWAAFAAAVARRYPRSAGIEVWNEPNLGFFFRPRPDAARIGELAAAANEAVDRVSPGIPVILGGLAPVVETRDAKILGYPGFLRDVYAASGTGRWDAVAIHPFPSFGRRHGYLSDVRAHLSRVRSVLADFGAAGTPIWVTEVGLSTTGPHSYRPRRQARGLTRIYRALAAMPDVAAVVVHRLVDTSVRQRAAEAGWGVLRRNGRPKPAFCALAAERGEPCPQRHHVDVKLGRRGRRG